MAVSSQNNSAIYYHLESIFCVSRLSSYELIQIPKTTLTSYYFHFTDKK